MRKSFFLLSFFLLLFACSRTEYVYDFSSSVMLKDKATVSFELLVEFKNKKGVDEIKEKLDKINHAIRIILAQRNEDQIDTKSRLVSVVTKVLKSQLSEPVSRISVEAFKIERMK